MPFDLSRLEVTGTPVPVVEGIRRAGLIGTSTGLTQFDFSRTGSLVYWPGPMNTVASGTDLALFDRTNKSQPLKLPPRPYRSPRVSPDGKFVALDSEDEREAIVWVYELAGTSAIRQLTFEGKNRAPIWSHDGQWIIFQSEREGGAGMFRQRADGSGTAERLTTSEPNAPHWPQAVSPDGAYLLFSMSSIQRTPTLWTMTLKDRRTEALTGIQAREASFSPNGRGIAYQSPGAGVVLEPFPRTGAKYLVHGVGGHPFWSPDGNEMFINSAPQRSTVIAFNTTPTVKFGRPVEFERVGRLEPNPAVARRNVDMLPNGEFFVGVLTGVTAAADEQQQIRVVLNWFDELRQRVPGR